MKNKFTLLSFLTIATSLSFAQTIPAFKTMEKKSNKISISDPKAVIYGAATQKAGGDPVWSDDFSTAGVWTLGSETGSTQGAFVIGAYPTQMTQYIGGMTNGTAPLASFNGIQYLLSGPVGVQNVWMASPAIDFSAVTSGIVTVSFNQRYRRFNNDGTFVEVSLDNGTTWTSFQVNTTAVGNGNVIQNTEILDVPVGAGVTQGKIRFRWESLEADDNYGSGYGWAIDNVAIKEGYSNNIALSQTFSAVGTQLLSYTKIPTTQAAAAGEVSFGAIAKNVGADAQDVVLTVTNGTYTQASSPVTINSFLKDTLQILTADGYTMPTTAGVNNFTYTLTSNNTLDVTGDDSGTVPFEVTSKVFAADAYNGTAASFGSSFQGWQNGTGNPEIGTYFEIFANQTLHAIQIGIASVPAASQATYNGRSIVAKIYEVDLAGGGDPIIVDATDEHYMVAGEYGGLLKLYFSIPVDLEAGKLYLVTASTILNEEIPIAFSGNVAAGNVAGKDGDTFIGLAPDAILGNVVQCPVVRMDFTDYSGIAELESQFNVNAYPNPFNASTEVAFELKNESPVSITVSDITGREVLNLGSTNYTAGKHTVTINGADLNAGVYNYSIKIGNSVITKRIVKK
jgi:hypothetical protein